MILERDTDWLAKHRRESRRLWLAAEGCWWCSLVSRHLVIAGDAAVVGLRGQHHVQLGLVRPSLPLVASVERQAQRVVVAEDDFLPVSVDAIKEGERERLVLVGSIVR